VRPASTGQDAACSAAPAGACALFMSWGKQVLSTCFPFFCGGHGCTCSHRVIDPRSMRKPAQRLHGLLWRITGPGGRGPSRPNLHGPRRRGPPARRFLPSAPPLVRIYQSSLPFFRTPSIL
jgi:hypothetical protein